MELKWGKFLSKYLNNLLNLSHGKGKERLLFALTLQRYDETAPFHDCVGQFWTKGYSTGVVDAYEHCDAPHDAGPLPLELMWFSQVAVEAGVQEADDGCENRTNQSEQKSCETLGGKCF